jgi:hypothetical protein
MKRAIRVLQLSATVVFCWSLLIVASGPEITQGRPPVEGRQKGRVDLAPDQSFSGAAGSTIEYNVYIKNTGKSTDNYLLTASSSQGYTVEVWQDTDQLNGGDVQLIPPDGYILTLDADEMATLVVRITLPSDAIDGTVDTTRVEAVGLDSGASDSVTLTTTVNSNLLYPSNWVQLGSDPMISSRPDKVDVKALYYTNNGTHVFFRMATADRPDPASFDYIVYLDTKPGGQQLDGHAYDYFLSSDGILYEWDGANWIDSGNQTGYRADGTSMVLWVNLDNLGLNAQDIHVLSRTVTEDLRTKDSIGPYDILRNNIAEMPLVLIPLVALALYFAVSGTRKRSKIRLVELKRKTDRLHRKNSARCSLATCPPVNLSKPI